jgi:hypothetical protein
MQETSSGKIVAQVRYASRPPGSVAGQNLLSEFYYRFGWAEQEM